MLKRLAKKMHWDERGITGLETAIILIAFVVVASVFAYTVLSAGIFSSQKGQEVVKAESKEDEPTDSQPAEESQEKDERIVGRF